MGEESAEASVQQRDSSETDSVTPPSQSTDGKESIAEQQSGGVNRKEESSQRGTASAGASVHRTATKSAGAGTTAGHGYADYDSGPNHQALSERYSLDFCKRGQAQKVQRLESEFGSDRVSRWTDEGMTVETMGKPQDMQAFRERQEGRSDEIPADIERQNQASFQRNVHRRTDESKSSGVETAVEHLHSVGELRAKLSVSSPNDPAEKEAEQVAAEVMKMDEPQAGEETTAGGETQRQHERETDSLQRSISVSRSASGGEASAGAEKTVQSALSGGGTSLSSDARSYFEPRFGADFSDVTVHTGSQADEAARSINAKAFTMGNNIAFAKGNYEPDSSSGKELMAHELTHVVQQTGGVNRSADASEDETGAYLNVNTGEPIVERDPINHVSEEYVVPFPRAIQEEHDVVRFSITTNPNDLNLLECAMQFTEIEQQDQQYGIGLFLDLSQQKALILVDGDESDVRHQALQQIDRAIWSEADKYDERSEDDIREFYYSHLMPLVSGDTDVTNERQIDFYIPIEYRQWERERETRALAARVDGDDHIVETPLPDITERNVDESRLRGIPWLGDYIHDLSAAAQADGVTLGYGPALGGTAAVVSGGASMGIAFFPDGTYGFYGGLDAGEAFGLGAGIGFDMIRIEGGPEKFGGEAFFREGSVGGQAARIIYESGRVTDDGLVIDEDSQIGYAVTLGTPSEAASFSQSAEETRIF